MLQDSPYSEKYLKELQATQEVSSHAFKWSFRIIISIALLYAHGGTPTLGLADELTESSSDKQLINEHHSFVTPLALHLVGTLVLEPGKFAALIELANGTQEIFTTGSEIPVGNFIKRIESNGVWIEDSQGTTFLLPLTGGTQARTARTIYKANHVNSSLNPFGMPDTGIPFQTLQSMLMDGNIVGRASYKVVSDRKDQKRGVTFSKIDPSSLLGMAGLQANDIITGINGDTIRDVLDLFHGLNETQTSRIVVFFERNGTPGSVAIALHDESVSDSAPATEY